MTKAFDLRKYFLSIGMFALVIGIALNRFGGDNPILSFISGIGFGLSLVMNTAFLIALRKKR